MSLSDLKFPLDTPPKCLGCRQPCDRARVSATNNTNGNAGRYYYVCTNRSHGRKWCCWDDDRGIASTNPGCLCGWRSREFTAQGEEYYGCPVGTCEWTFSKQALWSSCSNIEQFFGPPIVIGPGASTPRRAKPAPLNVEIGPEVQCKVTVEPGTSPLCSICRVALQKLRREDDRVSAAGSPVDRARAGCHLCAVITHHGRSRGDPVERKGKVLRSQYSYDKMDLGQATLYVMWLEPVQGRVNFYQMFDVELGCLPSLSYPPGKWSSNDGVDKTESDLEAAAANESPLFQFSTPFTESISFVKGWLQKCDAEHGAICRNPGSSNFIPSRVIDVGVKQIFGNSLTPVLRDGASLPPSSNYVTLSHCWGGVVPLRLLSSNLEALQQSIPLSQLPKTFQDAMTVAQALGVRYIWIDSLCIIQDDANDWQHEAALMADVYKNGLCNISATAAANSSAGLFLDHDPIYKKPVQAHFVTKDSGVVVHEFWPEGVLSHYKAEPLMRRGWVVQERLLSRRNLHFSRDQVYWECRTRSACEMFPDELPFKEALRDVKQQYYRIVRGGEQGPQSLTEVWNLLVADYTQSKLTKASDKLIAFAGIAGAFSGPLGDRYFAGMWLDNLAYQLCWSAMRSKEAAQGLGSSSGDFIAPSWSWASCGGRVWNAYLPVHPTQTVRQMEVLDISVDLATSNPYGQIHAGRLLVAGRLTTAKIRVEDSLYQSRTSRRFVLHVPNRDGQYSKVSDRLELSWTEDDLLEAQRSSGLGGDTIFHMLAVMEIASFPSSQVRGGVVQLDGRRSAGTRWIVLYPVAGRAATFTRCGTVSQDLYSGWSRPAAEWYDCSPGRLPVYSHTEETGRRYAVTIL